MPGIRKVNRARRQEVKVRRDGSKQGGSGAQETTRDQNVIRRVSRGGIAIQGNYNEVEIRQITQVFETAPPSLQEEEELIRLKEGIPKALAELKAATREKKPGAEVNPYRLLEALDPSEKDLLGGRSATIQLLTNKLKISRLAILVGDNGIGKTSLLRAGLIPAFIKAGHWPIWIEASGEPLDLTIKKRVLGSLDDYPALAARPMKDVLRLSAAFLKEESEIVLLLDDMEVLFRLESGAQKSFADLWRECINETGLRVRWVFSTTDIKHHLNRFQSGELNPFASLIALPPLDRLGARKAVLAPARLSDIQMDDSFLGVLLDDLGSEVDPTRLQIICHTLAGGNATLNKMWNLNQYEMLGRADGILRTYLDRAILELSIDEREPAWQVLSSLETSGDKPLPAGSLEKRLSSLGYRSVEVEALLDGLQRKHLVSLGEDGYNLTSESMKPRIREWREHEAIPKQIQKETARQLDQIRNSVLRGLLGGSVGLGLFRLIVGGLPRHIVTGSVQLLPTIFLTLLYGMIGGLIGLLLIFSVDLSRAMKIRLWLRYLIGGLGGAAAFSLALVMFGYLSIAGDDPLQRALSSAMVGSLWGMAAGLGITWGMITKRSAWLFILAVPLASGIMLFLGDSLLNILTRSEPLQIAIGGWVFPFFIAIGARLGHREGSET